LGSVALCKNQYNLVYFICVGIVFIVVAVAFLSLIEKRIYSKSMMNEPKL
jgi:uncharacterized membrane protein